MAAKDHHYVFVDESGDPGKPYEHDKQGNKIPTGASVYYILVALPITTNELFVLEDKIINLKNAAGYKKEIKSAEVSLGLYEKLLNVINECNIKVFYRFINKATYKGVFAVDGDKKLHNIFDEYNLKKILLFTLKYCDYKKAEIVIDRAERRLLDGRYDNINEYLFKKINTKTIQRIEYITHVNSEYVNIMQLVDLVCGAIKDNYMKRNTDLIKVIDKKLIKKIW